MAKKEPETVDRFRVSAEVPKERLGDVIASFTKMGLEHVGYELITDVLNFKQQKKFEMNGVDHLREWLKEHPTFTLVELKQHFLATGRSKDSAYNAIYKLLQEKEVKKLSPGNYQRADIKAIAPPKKAKVNGEQVPLTKKGTPRERKANKVVAYGVPNMEFLLKYARGRKKFTLGEIEAHFVKNKRNKKAVSPLLTALVQTHKVRRIAAGEYSSIKSRDYAAERERAKERETSKLNGAATPAATPAPEAVTNG